MALSKIEKDKIRYEVTSKMLLLFPPGIIQHSILKKMANDTARYEWAANREEAEAFYREYWIELFDASMKKLREQVKLKE